MRLTTSTLLLFVLPTVQAFLLSSSQRRFAVAPRSPLCLAAEELSGGDNKVDAIEVNADPSSVNDESDAMEVSAIVFASPEEKDEAVGNLVADDEWMGLSMELSEIVRIAVIEDIKGKARDFIGKEDYAVGDISKEIDTRVKSEVARIRGKDDYELGDFSLAMDQMSKEMTERLTGKPYVAGDLSIELDKRIKDAAASYCGKEEYEFGMLTKEVTSRVSSRVEEFTGKPYEFGDITRAVEEKRQQWVTDFLGPEAGANYQFGDITKQFAAKFTGKDEYQFGDVTKKVFGNLFGKRERKSGGSQS
jgi:hypothetical protein